MPRIPNNLHEWAIGMEHVAWHVGCSSRAIRNLYIRFRTTGSTDLPRRGRPRVTRRGQDRYIMNTHSPLLLLLTHVGFLITESVRKLLVSVCGRTVYMHDVLTLGERNVLFNDALNTFYLRLYGVRHMVKDHSDSEKGNPLPPHGLLFPINSKGSFICTIPQTG